ncbi:hypothetical protein JTB14_002088 [Gonioctena quinquepunctata]|nr:hypothetical protein JTB14_002088 [Gonioctena quinquepunctata]
MEGKVEVNRLEKEELSYELDIRGITGLTTVDSMRKSLRNLLKLEKAGTSLTFPSYPFTFDEDSVYIERKISEIEILVTDFSDSETSSSFSKIYSKLLHVFERTERSVSTKDEEYSKRSTFLIKLLDLKLNLLSKTRKFKRDSRNSQIPLQLSMIGQAGHSSSRASSLSLVEVHTVAELLQLCRQIEARKISIDSYSPPPKNRANLMEPDLAYVYSSCSSIAGSSREGHEVHGSRNNSSNRRCWNCGSDSHLSIACKEPQKRYCYSCGHPNATKRTCPKCNGQRQETTGGTSVNDLLTSRETNSANFRGRLLGAYGYSPRSSFEGVEIHSDQVEILDELVNDCFVRMGNSLGCTKIVEHKIELLDNGEPIKQRFYPVSPALMKHIDGELQDMLKKDVIEPSSSPWSSPIVMPLTELLKKNTKFVWTPRQEAALREVKEHLISAPVMACPNFDLPFIVQTDASGYGIGAVLTQNHPDVGERVVSYLSRSLTKQEKNFPLLNGVFSGDLEYRKTSTLYRGNPLYRCNRPLVTVLAQQP